MVSVFSAIILNTFSSLFRIWWRSIMRQRPWIFQQPIRRMGLALRRPMVIMLVVWILTGAMQ